MKSKKGLVVGAVALVALAGAAAAAAFVIRKNGDEKEQKDEEEETKYSFYVGKDYSWTGSENSIQITPYVSDEDTFKTCDALRSDGKGCVVAVRYGNNVYYRPRVVDPPLDWQGNSPSPSTDGSWVLETQ